MDLKITRSYASLRAADLDWIVGPEYSLGGKEEGGRAGINKNVTNAGSQLTWEGGGAGISKNVTHVGSQLPWQGGGAGISKNVTHAGSQLTF